MRTARKHWKQEAIPAIAALAEDTNWRAKEMAILTNQVTEPRVIAEGWLTDRMICMTNGEWLVYQSHCSKVSPRYINDIFLAKGSNGRWYYSTFHFCVGMCDLAMLQEEPPPNLAMFVHEYNLSEFDGQSDECLKPTKPFPASWTEKKADAGPP
jgi:hypothetical protein